MAAGRGQQLAPEQRAVWGAQHRMYSLSVQCVGANPTPACAPTRP